MRAALALILMLLAAVPAMARDRAAGLAAARASLSAALAVQGGSPWHAFWSDLKRCQDHFEATGTLPHVAVRDARYVCR